MYEHKLVYILDSVLPRWSSGGTIYWHDHEVSVSIPGSDKVWLGFFETLGTSTESDKDNRLATCNMERKNSWQSLRV